MDNNLAKKSKKDLIKFKCQDSPDWQKHCLNQFKFRKAREAARNKKVWSKNMRWLSLEKWETQ